MTHAHDPRGPVSRRSMLKAAGCAALTNTSLMSTLINLQATNSAVAAGGNTGGYKALVCLFLFGGNDSYNMLIPASLNGGLPGTGEYGDYFEKRGADDGGSLAIDRDELHLINGPNGRQFGLHPGMPEVQQLYNDGKLSFVANVGSLVQPTDRSNYDSKVDLPVGLFSHSDLQRHWMTSVPQNRSQITGWAGRMADVLTDTSNLNPTIAMNISINGVNLMLTGGGVIPYVIDEGGARTLSGYQASSDEDKIYTRALNNLLDQSYQDLLAKTFAQSSRNSIDAAIQFNDAIGTVDFSQDFFGTEDLSERFRTIAKTIGAASQLQQSRQIFFISVGGFDLHSNLISGHQNLLPKVSKALKNFYDALEDLGCENDVLTFTASDFARTLSTNGQGSDHGWGGNQILMGGGIEGGKIFGDYPTSLLNPTGLDENSNDYNLDVGRGRLIPTLSVDELSAEMAMWFGVDNGPDLEMILPNIRRFYSSTASGSPIGIFG